MRKAATAAAASTNRVGCIRAVRWASSNAEGETAAETVANASSTSEPQHLNHSNSSNSNTKKYVQLQERRVSNTWNIPKKDLFLDMLFNGQGPLLEPVKVEVAEKLFNSPLSRMYVTKNGEMKVNRHTNKALRSNSSSIHSSISGHHNRHHSGPTTITEDLARYRAIRDSRRDPNHNVFFSKRTNNTDNDSASSPSSSSTSSSPASPATIFTHSAVSQLPLENNALLNLPHSLLLSLQPFSCRTQPGDESYRDDRIVVRKLQIEEKEKGNKNNNNNKN